MRKKYFGVFRDKLRQFGPGWVARQGLRYFQVLYSTRTRRASTGPLSAVLMPTYRCNQRCRMCDFPSRRREDKPEMSTSQLKDLIDELADLPSLGVSFYGGEPLLRPDTTELIHHAHRRRLLVHLTTNGLTVDRPLAEGIIAAGTDVISISLDGATPEIHDRQRGVEGAHAGAISALNLFREARRSLSARTRLTVITVLTPENLDEVERIVEIARTAGADNHTIYEAQPLLETANNFSPRDLESLVEVNRTIARLKAVYPDYIDNSPGYIRMVDRLWRGGTVRLKCFAPYTDLFIDPYGRLYPCNHLLGLGIPQGQYEPGQLKRFWYSRGYQASRDKLKDCAACNYLCHRELSMIFNRIWPGRRPKFGYGQNLPEGIRVNRVTGES